jgi:hypothetical protein
MADAGQTTEKRNNIDGNPCVGPIVGSIHLIYVAMVGALPSDIRFSDLTEGCPISQAVSDSETRLKHVFFESYTVSNYAALSAVWQGETT